MPLSWAHCFPATLQYSPQRRRKSSVEVLGDVADVRRSKDIIQLAEWVVSLQRLDVEYIDCGSCDPLRLQSFDQGRFVDDRTARDVLMNRAVGFIRANSGAQLRPLVRRLRTRCIVMTSASRNSAGLSTRVAPAALAFASVRFWLQAITFIPKPMPIRATSLPILPNPSIPRLLHAGLNRVPFATCRP